jgi:hypothetical protein
VLLSVNLASYMPEAEQRTPSFDQEEKKDVSQLESTSSTKIPKSGIWINPGE